jgi:hypothetical protein
MPLASDIHLLKVKVAVKNDICRTDRLCKYIWSSTYDRPHLRPQKNNKLIYNKPGRATEDTHNPGEEAQKTVQTKLSMFLIKKTSPTSTQEHNPDMYYTVSLSKR